MNEIIKQVLGLIDGLTLGKDEKEKLRNSLLMAALEDKKSAREADAERSKSQYWLPANIVHILAIIVLVATFGFKLYGIEVDSTPVILVLSYYFGSAVTGNVALPDMKKGGKKNK